MRGAPQRPTIRRSLARAGRGRPALTTTLAAAELALGASAGSSRADTEAWQWQLPAEVAPPRVPADNPMTPEKVDLGRHLFYDSRLSGNESQSCASCHRQELAFTDGRPRAIGSTGEMHPRSSMSLTNVAYLTTLTWDRRDRNVEPRC